MKIIQQQSGLSRRKSRQLVEEGEIVVNGEVEENPFEQYELAEIETLYLRGHPLPTYSPKHRAYKYFKPTDVLCSHDDPHYGRTVGRILRSEGFIGYTWAGRLDQDAEGLIVLTNDGQLVHLLTHPRYDVKKKYHIWFSQHMSHGKIGEIIDRFVKGIEDDGELLQAESGGVVDRGDNHTQLQLVLTEGRKNEIKRMCAYFDLNIMRLRRISLGPVELGGLSPGDISRITTEEMERLQDLKKEKGE